MRSKSELMEEIREVQRTINFLVQELSKAELFRRRLQLEYSSLDRAEAEHDGRKKKIEPKKKATKAKEELTKEEILDLLEDLGIQTPQRED